MIPLIHIVAGGVVATVAVALLHWRWKDAQKHRSLVAMAWVAIAIAILVVSAAFNADVGTSFAVIMVMFAGLFAVFKGKSLDQMMPFPQTRKASAEAAGRVSWSGTTARTLSSVIVAPVVGMASGLVVWTTLGGHDATRFVTSVFVFLIGFALLQIWSLSAERAWRALGMITALGAVLAAALYLRL